VATPGKWGADGWAKNQLGERRLGEFFFGRQTTGRQQSFQKRRFGERRMGDKDLSSLPSCSVQLSEIIDIRDDFFSLRNELNATVLYLATDRQT